MKLLIDFLFEGSEDYGFCREMLPTGLVPAWKDLTQPKGIDQVLESISVKLIQTGAERLAIVVDRDDPTERDRWAAVRDRLITSGYTDTPHDLPASGLIISQAEMMPVGVWIMPDNRTAGALEDFIFSLARPHDLVLGHARSVIRDLPHREFTDRDENKALLFTWLAWL